MMIANTGKENAHGYNCGLETWYLTLGMNKLEPGQCLLQNKPEWIKKRLPFSGPAYWAPTLLDGRTLYYSIDGQPFDGSIATVKTEDYIGGCIGLMHATGSPPKLIWKDIGKPVFCSPLGEDNGEQPEPSSIDPAIFKDGDSLRLIYGGGHIWSIELNPKTGMPFGDSVWNPKDPYQHHLANGPTVNKNGSPAEEEQWVEAAYMHKYETFYYLFVNWYACCGGPLSTYEIRVGRSLTPDGPFLDKDGIDLRNGGGTLLLDGNDKKVGPGHAGILEFSDSGQNRYILSHHYYPADWKPDSELPEAYIDFRELVWENNWPKVLSGTVNPDISWLN